MSDHHQTVLLNESIEALAIKPDGFYIDATFGRGGHSREIVNRLSSHGRLLAIDKDPQAVEFARQHFSDDKRFSMIHGSFSQLKALVGAHASHQKADGILIDLGVSSPQLDEAARGFSFTHDGPLDMRMDPTVNVSAAEWLATVKEHELCSVLKEYGEEKFAKRIAWAIVNARREQAILRTKQLADIVSKANPAWERHKHPATRTFQAIRIFINNELNDLKQVLNQCLEVLAPKGRLVVISFHSLEDRNREAFFASTQQGIITGGIAGNSGDVGITSEDHWSTDQTSSR